MKRVLILFLAAALLLTGCAGKVESAALREHYELDIRYECSFLFNDLGWAYTVHDSLMDETLRDAAAGIRVEYPLTTAEQIQTYACGLYDFCVEQGYFPASLSVFDAVEYEQSSQYPQNIWLLCFLSPDSRLYDDPGPGAYVLVSGIDGHIIAWEYDETGEGISAAIAGELYTLNYIVRDTFIPEDFTAADWLDDEALQAAAAEIPMDYPITTDEQIRKYAWALYEIAMERELFRPHLVPHFALLQDDGILRLSFSDLAFATEGVFRYDGEGAHFWVSEEDGHIIDIEITQYED